MKRTIKWMALLLCAAVITTMATSCDSDEWKITKCKKKAIKYKASLGTKATILAEVIDSSTQEIIYIKWGNSDVPWDFVDSENNDKPGVLEVHSFATGVTENVLANWPKKGEYIYFKDSRLIKNRLFLNFWDGRYGTALIYVDIKDNSIHNVAFPEKAEISDKQIVLTEMYLVHDSDYECYKEWERKKFVINTDLTDAEYETAAQMRKKDLQNTEKKAMEEDKRHRRIAKKEKKNVFCILNYLDGSGGGLQLRMSGLIGNVSVTYFCQYDEYNNEGSLEFETNNESWKAEIKWANDESGRMMVSLENGAKGELIGYLHGTNGNATYEGTYIDPSGNETPFKFFDDFQYWGF